jgi:hypothetical protein
MIKSFENSDCSIRPDVLESFPDLKSTLERLNEIEISIQEKWTHYQRLAIVTATEPNIHQKILRIYVRHQFFPASTSDRAHFLIRVEGSIADPKYKYSMCSTFGSFFDRIRVMVDKRFYAHYSHLEWDSATASVSASQKGNDTYSSPSCIEFKLFGEKVRIFIVNF